MTQYLGRDTQAEIVADCISILGWERFLALLLISLYSMAYLFNLRNRHFIINKSNTPIGLIIKVNLTLNSLAENILEELLKEGVKQDFLEREILEDISTELLDRTVSHVTLDKSGKVAVHFINGAVVRVEGEK